MRSLFVLLAASLLPMTAIAQPVTLKPDELAVLADQSSPDKWKLMERYDGKVVKIEGRATYRTGGSRTVVAVDTTSGYYLAVPGAKASDPKTKIRFEWATDPSLRKTQEQISHKSDEDRQRVKEKKPVADPGFAVTIYGRLDRSNALGMSEFLILADATTDPKTGGIPYRRKVEKKEPARLKD